MYTPRLEEFHSRVQEKAKKIQFKLGEIRKLVY